MSAAALRALWALTRSSLARLAREGAVVRALAWPGLLCVGTVLAVAAVAAPAAPALTVVDRPHLAAALDAQGWPVAVHPDPVAQLAGPAERAVVTGPAGATLTLAPEGWARHSGRRTAEDLAVEGIVRDAIGAGWRLAVPPDPGPAPARAAAQAALLLRLIAMVCTLYAVVLTVAGAVRDRENGVLEAIHTSPCPPWAPALARALAVVLGCGGALLTSGCAVAGVLPDPGIAGQLPGLLAGVVGGAAVGTAALGGAGRTARGPLAGAPPGMSAPLRQALVAASGLGALGALWPAVGWLPVAGLGAPAGAPGAGGVALLLAARGLGLAARRVGGGGW